MFFGVVVAVSVFVMAITFIATKNNIQKVAASRYDSGKNNAVKTIEKLPIIKKENKQVVAQKDMMSKDSKKRTNNVSR